MDEVAWREIGIAMMSLVFVLYGFAYMIGIGFQLPKVKAWARNEFYQAVVSAIILGGMVGLVLSINGLMNNLIGLPGTQTCDPYGNCAVKYAVDFFGGVRGGLLVGYSALAGTNFGLGIAASLRISAAPHQTGVGFAPTPGLNVVCDLLGIMMQFYGIGIGLAWVNTTVLEFIGIQLMMLFPLGCVMRSFPWTRGAGAAIMALCIGLYVVYPLLVTLDSWIVSNDMGSSRLSSCNFNPLSWNGCLDNWFTDLAYNVVIVTVFMPVFNLTLAFGFTKELARLLGGDIDVSALAKLL